MINFPLIQLQLVRAFALHAEDRILKFRSLQAQVVKTGSGSSTAKRSAVGVNVTDPRR